MGDAQRREPLGALWRRATVSIGRLDSRLLLEQACACTHAELIAHPEREPSAEQRARFEALLARREAGEPLAYLLGSAFFHGLEFMVSPAVLIPRADTEVLVEQARRHVQVWGPERAAPRVVDLGTGSGIVAIVLAQLCPTAVVTGVDLSAAALVVARANAALHRVPIRFLQGDWYAPLREEQFDLIVSNPPYVAAGDPHLQRDGLPFEPRDALTDAVAGGDGLACIRTLIEGAGAHLVPQGWMFIEHGYDQAVKVRAMLGAAGLQEVASWPDEAAIERVSGGRQPTP